MLRIISRAIRRLGQAAVFGVGLAVALLLLLGPVSAGLAAVPGDPFKLGRKNAIDKLTALVGSATGPLLKVDNNGGGPALWLEVEGDAAPLAVSSSGKVDGLNADLFDGLDAGQFVRATYVERVTRALGSDAQAQTIDVSCRDGDFALGGGFGELDSGTTPRESSPQPADSQPTGWRASFVAQSYFGDEVSVYVVCAQLG